MEIYHLVWAESREKSEEWLRTKLDGGFHIHHVNGDHGDNRPENLMLVYGPDHMALHGMDLRKLIKRPKKPRKPKTSLRKLRRDLERQMEWLRALGLMN